MARAADALLPLKGAQATASGPDAHVWLSASAGTGKTHVLTARVFRLLLGGVPPENILCLTFTKAGASEMAERIHARLAAWVQMDGPALADDLKALGEIITPEMRERARQLFARVLEATGGGLRIQTIHSFCQQLLSSFPLEAGLVPGFRALEDREQQELAREALEELVVDAEARGDDALMAAFHALALRLGEKEAQAYLGRCARAHGAMLGLPEDVRGWLFRALDLPEGDVEAAIAERCADDAFDVATLARLARANAEWGTEKTGLPYADAIACWLASSNEGRAALLAEMGACFIKKDGAPRAAQKGQIKADADYEALSLNMAEAIGEIMKLRERVGYADLAAQGLLAGRAFAKAYEAIKRRVGAVDYDDLIAHSAALLGSAGIADWIRYKLDQRIDHILVDEAQDTNSRQWTIIGALVEEFFAGEGARGGVMRTLFTVGDFKQAIFGFQGTSPRAFAQARDHFRELADQAEHDFHDLSLDESFRSTPAVLETVDATVAALGVDAFGLPPQIVLHRSANVFPGIVGLLKPVSAVPGNGEDDEEAEPEGEEDWFSDQDRMLAERIAGQIKAWLDTGRMLESKGRAMRPGDVMILLRKRGALARLIVARLYEAGVPVAGVDRLRLQAPLGVQDLMAALRFASQPEDDLTLACLLVSPLIGWSQEELLARAVPRKGGLWRHLRESPLTPPDDLATLFDILNRADFITPYRLMEHVLSGPMQGRRKLIARLGEEARDSIEELLNAALDYEQREQPSLQEFIDWFDREEGEIKREDDGRADAVRLLTVHGAKGLQAPVVILADACVDPAQKRRRDSLDIPLGDDPLPVVPPRKAERWGIVDTAVEYQDGIERQEHWRLLYVAMTRAEEQLYVTGALGKRAKGEVAQESWYAATERAMKALGAEWREDAHWGAAMEWRGAQALAPAKPANKPEQEPKDRLPLPDWVRQPAPVETRPPRPLAPTAPTDDELPYPPPSPAMRDAAERGRLLHSLFERLPDVAPEHRAQAADNWLARQGGVEDERERARLVSEALSIIDDPAHAMLFGPASLAEAPVAAVVGGDVVKGVIDRLAVNEEAVLLVDFKTGRHVPETVSEIPPAHLRQMAAYVAALEVVFPGRRIEAGLLYTSGPKLVPLDEAALAPHKPGLVREN